MLGKWKLFFKKIKRNGFGEKVKFRLLTSLKITSIPFLSFLILGTYIYILLRGNLIFFQTNELTGVPHFEEIFYDSLLFSIADFTLYGVSYFVFINLISIYISHLLLRPFRMIGDYCDREFLGRGEKDYNPDLFSELKLLGKFSEYFFNSIENAAKVGKLTIISPSSKYGKIHRPIFEPVFFFHFSFFILIMILTLFIIMFKFSDEIYGNLISLAGDTLPSNSSIGAFLKGQSKIMETITFFSLSFGVLIYSLMAYHLYQKVAAPAFAFFSTMRSFLKGNYKRRVHLVGFSYLREYAHKFNKYLDRVEKELVSNKKGKG